MKEETNGGIMVVHTKDIVGFVYNKHYKLNTDLDGLHQNDKIWKLFASLFIEKYLKQ